LTELAVWLDVFLIRVFRNLINIAYCGLLTSSRELRLTFYEQSLLRSWTDLSFLSADLRSKSCTVFIKAFTYNKIHVYRKQRTEVMQGCDDFASNLETLSTRNVDLGGLVRGFDPDRGR
jgi:hypothetical protein